jgi:hypothetical protein
MAASRAARIFGFVSAGWSSAANEAPMNCRRLVMTARL